MEFFDTIVMLVGCALIIVGVVLFAIGKKESANQNNVEGFGIKVNVSNPSIILIVLGIGLLLVPRLLPTTQSNSNVDNSAATQPQLGLPASNDLSDNDVLASVEDDEESGFEANQSSEHRSEQGTDNSPEQNVNSVQDNNSQAYFPTGLWQLSDYAENGIDLTDNVNGAIEFLKRTNNQYDWHTDFIVIDGWGNTARYQYRGTMRYQSGNYFISIVSSTDPSFMGQQSAPMELKIDNDGRLHMGYRINNIDILIHWLKN